MLNFLQQYFKTNEKLAVIQWLLSQPSPLSSQCVTLGSRHKNIWKLGDIQRILGAYVRNNAHKIDPSVTRWDDIKRRHWGDIEKTHWDDMKRGHWDDRERAHWDDIEKTHWYDKRGVL